MEKNENEIKRNKSKASVKPKVIKPKKKSNSDIIMASVITAIICLVVFILFYVFFLKDLVIEKTRIERDVTVTDVGIADAVDKVYDSVVVVETYRGGQLYSTGTGFVFKTVDDTAYILTNYHVINGGDEIKVIFTNDESYTVEVVNGDEFADVAVLSISKDKIISVAELGNSEELRVGDTTFAVGAPIDSSAYSWTVTRGILSGKNRVVEISTGTSSIVMEALQTDTAINSGNSGGPLCNSNGEVIGITNMKLSSTTIEGMAFAIPIETALEYADAYITGESIRRPFVGISMYDSVTMFGQKQGLFVDSVQKGSPAEKAGLQSGDKITKINDVKVSDSSYFKYELYKYEVGDTIKITYERDGKENTTDVVLGTASEGA